MTTVSPIAFLSAGPGAPDLLTVRGRELLDGADIIFADREVSPQFWRGLPAEVEQPPPANVVDAMLEAARRGRVVVRLHHADGFSLRRGRAEAAAVATAGFAYVVVPGVSLPAAAASHAGALEAGWTYGAGAARVVWPQASGGDATLEALRKALPGSTPVVVIEEVATPRQTQMKTTLAALPGAFRSPALVVANPSSSGLDWFERQPLFGRRVVVTRPPHQAEPTVRELARRGAQPIRFATIAITDPPEPERIKTALAQLSEYDLVVFTSANGVDFFFARLRERGLDSRALGGLELAAIGPATAARLNHHGLYADIQAETFVAEYLVEAIVARWQGRSAGRVLLPRALVARELLPEELRRHGFTVDVLPVYETVDAASAERDALRSLLARGVDAILLTSSSTVERLARALGDDASARLADVTLASIGPITTKTAEDLGLTVAVTASVSTGPGLIDALETYFRVHGNESPQRKVI